MGKPRDSRASSRRDFEPEEKRTKIVYGLPIPKTYKENWHYGEPQPIGAQSRVKAQAHEN